MKGHIFPFLNTFGVIVSAIRPRNISDSLLFTLPLCGVHLRLFGQHLKHLNERTSPKGQKKQNTTVESGKIKGACRTEVDGSVGMSHDSFH